MGKVRKDTHRGTRDRMLLMHNSYTTRALISHHSLPPLPCRTACGNIYGYTQTPIWRVECRVATDWSAGSVLSGPVHADAAR